MDRRRPRGGGLKDAALQALGKPQHIDGAIDAGLRGLNGIVLIVDGRSRAGEIVDFIDLHIERKGHIVAYEFKARVADEMGDIGLGAGKEIVDANNIVALSKERSQR